MVDKKVRAHIFIEGRVQGVSFRWWVARNARGLELVGWARNLDDGRVELVVEGSRENIDKLLKKCLKGPTFANVIRLEKFVEDATGEFKNFEIMA